MSQYYKIKDLKVRVPNHEPNEALNGSSDIYLWLNDATGMPLKLDWQIEKACEDFELNMEDFNKIIEDYCAIKRFCITTFDAEDEEVNEWVTENCNTFSEAEKEANQVVGNSRDNEFRYEVREISALNHYN